MIQSTSWNYIYLQGKSSYTFKLWHVISYNDIICPGGEAVAS